MNIFEGGDGDPQFPDWDMRELQPDNDAQSPFDSLDRPDPDLLPTDVAEELTEKMPHSEAEVIGILIHNELKVAVGELCQELRMTREDGNYKYSSPSLLLPIVADAAEEAAVAGDAAAIEDYIDAFGGPLRDSVDYARLCYAGVTIGSQRSFDGLQKAIKAGKDQYDAQFRQYKRGEIVTPPAPVPGSLRVVMRACAEQGLPYDTWVERAAVDSNHRWHIEVDGLAESVRRGEVDQATLDAKVGELCTAEEPDGQFVLQVTREALERAKDPAVRIQLIGQLKALISAEVIPLNTKTFNDMNGIGAYVAGDPELSTTEHIRFFEGIIASGAKQALDAHCIEDHSITDIQTQWKINLRRLQDPTTGPREVVEVVDLQIGQAVASAKGAVRFDQDFWPNVYFNDRDRILGQLARDTAVGGDFASAQVYIDNTLNENYRLQCLQNCLELAETPEQVAIMRESADEFMLAFHPELNAQFSHAELLTSGDISAITERAVEYAQSMTMNGRPIDVERTPLMTSFLRRGYHTLAAIDAENQAAGHDAPTVSHASAYAHAVLDGLRSCGVKHAYTTLYSDHLIANGDAEEPQRAYDYINTSETSHPEGRLLALSRLAHVIAGRKYEN